MKTLLVDDSVATRFIIIKMLNKLGIKDIIQAEHGKQALELLTVNPDVSLALIDWNMPIMGGLELITNIRHLPRYNSIQILMVTTETDMSNVEKALLAGANEYIMKPFDQESIEAKLKLMGIPL